ncbi:MAG TPA: cupin domain-containing protein [Gaiellaceae bacterium]|jgi:quercetin dioxygenase-like cupin family protein
MPGYTRITATADDWVATRTLAEYGRTYVDLTARLDLKESRARLWTYPVGAKGVPHLELAQEEVFAVLRGTLTLLLGDPATRETLPAGSVVAVSPGTPIHVRNESDAEVTFLVYGAPPVPDAETLTEPATA